MLYSERFSELVLFQPIRDGANKLKIISGYAMPTMASWHIKEIAEPARGLSPIDITLIVGMTKYDGILQTAHEGFKGLMARNGTLQQSNFTCQYVCNGSPIHSKLYLWERDGEPFRAFVGSANYTQTAFSQYRRELLNDCDPIEATNYFNAVEPNTIYCNNAEIEEYITLTRRHPVLETEEITPTMLIGAGVFSVTLPLITIRTGETESVLLTIFVLPEYQCKGIGRKIIQTLESDEYFLRTNRIEIPASITACEFYIKMGYAYKGGKKILDDEGHYRMEKFR